jgi:hypothetical protein
MVIGDAGKALFTPAISSRALLVVGEIVPGISVNAIVFANCAPLLLTFFEFNASSAGMIVSGGKSGTSVDASLDWPFLLMVAGPAD